MARAALLAVAVLVSACVPSPETAAVSALPGPGGDGRGDALFPGLGNGGYDVEAYDIALAVSADGTVETSTTITAVAVRPLTAISLDLAGLDVDAVRLGGGEALDYSRSGRELAVRFPRPVEEGERFVVVVDTEGTPVPAPVGGAPYGAGWHVARDGTRYSFAEPDGASTWFPADDHPSDRAAVRLTAEVPDGWTAVSGASPSREGAAATFVLDRTAPYLVPFAAGPLVREVRGGEPVWRSEGVSGELLAALDRQGEIVAFLTDLLGPYPGTYAGSLVVDDDLPAALETEDLPTYTSLALTAGETVVVHEIAHQWLGNAVGIESWSDVWIKEGLATVVEWLWSEHTDGPEGYAARVAEARRRLAAGDHPPPAAPPADDLYNPAVYLGAALAWDAVREEVGADAFAEFLASLVETYTSRLLSTGELLSYVDARLGPAAGAALRSGVLGPG